MAPSSRRCLAGVAALVALALAGCFDDPTQIVVVVDTDAKPGSDFTQVEFLTSTIDEPGGAGQGPIAFSNGDAWPVTLAVNPLSAVPSFTVQVRLVAGKPMSFDPNGGIAFSTRTAKDVRFVAGQRSVLFIPMLRSCACVDASGMPITSCARALDPDCKDLSDPPVSELDEDHLPRLPAAARSP